jgi:hypothetical protein
MPSQREGQLTTTLVTKLLTNPLAQSRSTEDAGDHSPVSGPLHHTGRLSMAWKESERPNLGSIWAQRPRLGITERLLDRGGYFIHARLRPTDRSPPIWGQGSRVQISPECLQASQSHFCPPCGTPSEGSKQDRTRHHARLVVSADQPGGSGSGRDRSGQTEVCDDASRRLGRATVVGVDVRSAGGCSLAGWPAAQARGGQAALVRSGV